MSHKKLSSRTIISYILSFLITVFISALILVTITRFTIMSPSFLINKMESSDFFKQSVVTLNDEIQQETQSTGFPLEMFENYVDEASATVAMENYINDAFNNGSTIIDSSDFETKLNSDIDNYLTSANIIINNDSREAISILKTNLVDYYKNTLSFPYLDMLISIINAYQHYFLIVAIVLIILIITAGIILYRLYSHYQGRRRYFAYALSSSGLICLVLPSILYFGKFVNKISLSPAYFYNFFTSSLNSYLFIYVIVGVILIIIANILAYIKFNR